MATVMCIPKLRPSQALQPPNVTSTKYVIVRRADEVSHTWTRAHPVMPLHRQKIVISGCPLSAKGAHTPKTIGAVIQTMVTEPSPRRRLPPSHLHSISYRASCSWRIAGINEYTSRRHPPHSINSGTWRHYYLPGGAQDQMVIDRNKQQQPTPIEPVIGPILIDASGISLDLWWGLEY
jgi:hypothetical protein